MSDTKTEKALAAEETPKNAPSKTDKEILADLKAAAKGLLFPSESDRPVKAFLWADAKTESGEISALTLHEAGKLPDGAKAETLTPQEFFAPVAEKQAWFDEAQNEGADRFQKLLNLLQTDLTGLQAFRITEDGDDQSVVTAYVVGRTGSGTLAGICTELVET